VCCYGCGGIKTVWDEGGDGVDAEGEEKYMGKRMVYGDKWFL